MQRCVEIFHFLPDSSTRFFCRWIHMWTTRWPPRGRFSIYFNIASISSISIFKLKICREKLRHKNRTNSDGEAIKVNYELHSRLLRCWFKNARQREMFKLFVLMKDSLKSCLCQGTENCLRFQQQTKTKIEKQNFNSHQEREREREWPYIFYQRETSCEAKTRLHSRWRRFVLSKAINEALKCLAFFGVHESLKWDVVRKSVWALLMQRFYRNLKLLVIVSFDRAKFQHRNFRFKFKSKPKNFH